MLFLNVTIKWQIYSLPLPNLSTYLLEIKLLTLNKEKYFFYQIPDKTNSKRVTPVRFLSTDVYLDKK